MILKNLVSDNIGLVHLLFSILSLVFGTFVLFKNKGTNQHRKVGYLYTASMIGLLVTAFMIFRLFGKFGIFHWLAILSSLTLLAGIIPMVLQKPKGYITLHFSFMYWSVIGLYAAFVAETAVRIPRIVIENAAPNATFFNIVGVVTFLIMGFAGYIFSKKTDVWSKFDQETGEEK